MVSAIGSAKEHHSRTCRFAQSDDKYFQCKLLNETNFIHFLKYCVFITTLLPNNENCFINRIKHMQQIWRHQSDFRFESDAPFGRIKIYQSNREILLSCSHQEVSLSLTLYHSASVALVFTIIALLYYILDLSSGKYAHMHL